MTAGRTERRKKVLTCSHCEDCGHSKARPRRGGLAVEPEGDPRDGHYQHLQTLGTACAYRGNDDVHEVEAQLPDEENLAVHADIAAWQIEERRERPEEVVEVVMSTR